MSKSLGTASIKIKNASFAIFNPPVKITTLIITLIIMSKITRLVNFKIIAAIITPTEFNVSPKKCHKALFTLRLFSFFKLLISTNISIILTKSPITAIVNIVKKSTCSGLKSRFTASITIPTEIIIRASPFMNAEIISILKNP